MIYDLPETLTVMGEERPIRPDYRAALDICAALADPELTDREKTLVALCICYPRLEEIPAEGYQEALERCFWFLDGGEVPAGNSRPGPRLMDWEQDFPRIVAPVNRVLGREVREGPCHWWTFLAAYYEIGGDCLFAQIVRVRDALARGKGLDKADRAWYRRNRELVDLRQRYTGEEEQLLKEWGGG